MEAYATDEQQIEAIRKWFKQYGNRLLNIVLVIAVIGLSLQYWFHHKEVTKIEASEKYTHLITSQSQNDEQSASLKAAEVVKDYPKTPYAALAGLYLAKHAIEQGNKEEAIGHLEKVVTDSSIEEFSMVARARLARIYLSDDKTDEAMKAVTVKTADGFSPLLEEIKGDIYMQQNDKEKAKAAYEHALSLSVEKNLENPLLKLKVEELGGKVPEQKEGV